MMMMNCVFFQNCCRITQQKKTPVDEIFLFERVLGDKNAKIHEINNSSGTAVRRIE